MWGEKNSEFQIENEPTTFRKLVRIEAWWSIIYLPRYIHIYLFTFILTRLDSNRRIRGYKTNTADISLTSPLYSVFVSLKKMFWPLLYTGLPLFLFLFFSRQWRNRFGWIRNQVRLLYVQEIIREMGTSFQSNDFWDSFCGQALVMIG